jgi:hypothetical protein
VEKFNCTPNPLIENSLKLIDVKTVKPDFCDQIDIKIDEKVCLKKCKRDCIQEYFNILSNSELLKGQNSVFMRLGSRNVPIFQYKFESQYTFVTFISNIGGIMSLWFGFAITDIYIIIKKIMIFIKIFLAQYLFNYLDLLIETLRKIRVLKFIVRVITIFKKFIDRLDKYDIKLIVKFLCIPLFFYQVIEMTQIYLYFSTNVNAELVPIMKDEIISVRKFPALTVCHEKTFSSLFYVVIFKTFEQFLVKSRQDSSYLQKFSWNKDIEEKIESRNYTSELLNIVLKSLKKLDSNKYKDILEFIVNSIVFGKNDKSLGKYSTTIDEMKFFSNHFNCFVNINQTFNCSEISEIVPSFSFLGDCNTFLFKMRAKFGSNNELRFTDNENILLLTKPYLFPYDYIVNRIYIHSSELMPSLSNYDWTRHSNDDIEFSEYNFKKLEYPYDTDCRIYKNKSQAECLNDCYIRIQNESNDCIQNDEFLILFNITTNGLEPDMQFCLNDSNFKNNSFFGDQLKFCNKECPVSCEEQIFIVESSRDRLTAEGDDDLSLRKLNLNFYKSYYIDINYSPNMLFLQYIIGVANLMSLWHGIDFTLIRDTFFRFIVKFLMWTKIEIIINQIFETLMDNSFLRIFVIILSTNFKSMVKNLKVCFHRNNILSKSFLL